jgi:hypothetical protein
MAAELVTLIYCDRHLVEKDEKVPGETFTWDKLTVDLCEECAGPIAQASALFADYGAKGKRTRLPKKQAQPSDPDVLKCPECGKLASNRDSLASHGRQYHDKSLSQLLGEDTPYQCDICPRAFGTVQGRAAHRARTHPDAAPVVK